LPDDKLVIIPSTLAKVAFKFLTDFLSALFNESDILEKFQTIYLNWQRYHLFEFYLNLVKHLLSAAL
jgi:hypothetical protein